MLFPPVLFILCSPSGAFQCSALHWLWPWHFYLQILPLQPHQWQNLSLSKPISTCGMKTHPETLAMGWVWNEFHPLFLFPSPGNAKLIAWNSTRNHVLNQGNRKGVSTQCLENSPNSPGWNSHPRIRELWTTGGMMELGNAASPGENRWQNVVKKLFISVTHPEQPRWRRSKREHLAMQH